jgi:hypothetical protein
MRIPLQFHRWTGLKYGHLMSDDDALNDADLKND